MPEKALTVATYAAGASLATIAIVYVFAPTYFLDATPSGSNHRLSSLTHRKNGVVGLVNAANDCFINSVLQALAGLGDLRIYLIRETHRRNMDDAGVYTNAVPDDASLLLLDGEASPRRPVPVWKTEGLQAGLVTKGLKDMIDQLNERPIVKKTISAVPFVRVLETAFRQRISRQQQDAQEFLQVVAERLCDEYHAGQRARRYARRKAAAASANTAAALDTAIIGEKLAGLAVASDSSAVDASPPSPIEASAPGSKTVATANANGPAHADDDDDDEDGFPMEGKIESQIECLTCGFKPRPSEQTFCTLTLNVPQVSSTSLSVCFDSMLKTEYIDDFKCEKCRLLHAVEVLQADMSRSRSTSFTEKAAQAVRKLQMAIEVDPESPPDDVELPDVRFAPKRKIARHFRLIRFPKVLAVHLSRSIYDVANMSQKNSAKVAFPERLPLGSLLQQRKYKLLGLVTHKGNHYSGHYESFRRQTVAEPFSNHNTFAQSTVYSPSCTPAATPKMASFELGASKIPTANGSPLSSIVHLPPAVSDGGSPVPPQDAAHHGESKDTPVRSSWSSSLRGRSDSTSLPLPPTSVPRDLQREEGDADHVAETSSIRSITRSTLSRLTSSSRSGSRNGSRPRSLNQLSLLRSVSKDGAETTTEADKKSIAGTEQSTRVRRKKRPNYDKWWRISDEKVREASTREVLGMQREVYLLFYELERHPNLA